MIEPAAMRKMKVQAKPPLKWISCAARLMNQISSDKHESPGILYRSCLEVLNTVEGIGVQAEEEPGQYYHRKPYDLPVPMESFRVVSLPRLAHF